MIAERPRSGIEIYRVPLLDLARAPQIATPATLKNLECLLGRWTSESISALIGELGSSTAIVPVQDVPGFRTHRLSRAFTPVPKVGNLLVRRQSEIYSVVAHFSKVKRNGLLFAGTLIDTIKAIAQSVGVDPMIRQGPMRSSLDAQRRCVEYPPPSQVHARISELEAWFHQDRGCRNIAACVLMNALFNVHPLIDGNGRVGRVLLNLALGREATAPFYLPIADYAHASPAEYILALREAQYNGQWNYLLSFIDACAWSAQDAIDRTINGAGDGLCGS